jgi:hypothetical protein
MPRSAGHAVNAYADDDLRYWAEKWDISQEELRRAIAKVGPQTEALARYLGKSL